LHTGHTYTFTPRLVGWVHVPAHGYAPGSPYLRVWLPLCHTTVGCGCCPLVYPVPHTHAAPHTRFPTHPRLHTHVGWFPHYGRWTLFPPRSLRSWLVCFVPRHVYAWFPFTVPTRGWVPFGDSGWFIWFTHTHYTRTTRLHTLPHTLRALPTTHPRWTTHTLPSHVAHTPTPLLPGFGSHTHTHTHHHHVTRTVYHTHPVPHATFTHAHGSSHAAHPTHTAHAHCLPHTPPHVSHCSHPTVVRSVAFALVDWLRLHMRLFPTLRFGWCVWFTTHGTNAPHTTRAHTFTRTPHTHGHTHAHTHAHPPHALVYYTHVTARTVAGSPHRFGCTVVPVVHGSRTAPHFTPPRTRLVYTRLPPFGYPHLFTVTLPHARLLRTLHTFTHGLVHCFTTTTTRFCRARSVYTHTLPLPHTAPRFTPTHTPAHAVGCCIYRDGWTTVTHPHAHATPRPTTRLHTRTLPAHARLVATHGLVTHAHGLRTPRLVYAHPVHATCTRCHTFTHHTPHRRSRFPHCGYTPHTHAVPHTLLYAHTLHYRTPHTHAHRTRTHTPPTFTHTDYFTTYVRTRTLPVRAHRICTRLPLHAHPAHGLLHASPLHTHAVPHHTFGLLRMRTPTLPLHARVGSVLVRAPHTHATHYAYHYVCAHRTRTPSRTRTHTHTVLLHPLYAHTVRYYHTLVPAPRTFTHGTLVTLPHAHGFVGYGYAVGWTPYPRFPVTPHTPTRTVIPRLHTPGCLRDFTRWPRWLRFTPPPRCYAFCCCVHAGLLRTFAARCSPRSHTPHGFRPVVGAHTPHPHRTGSAVTVGLRFGRTAHTPAHWVGSARLRAPTRHGYTRTRYTLPPHTHGFPHTHTHYRFGLPHTTTPLQLLHHTPHTHHHAHTHTTTHGSHCPYTRTVTTPRHPVVTHTHTHYPTVTTLHTVAFTHTVPHWFTHVTPLVVTVVPRLFIGWLQLVAGLVLHTPRLHCAYVHTTHRFAHAIHCARTFSCGCRTYTLHTHTATCYRYRTTHFVVHYPHLVCFTPTRLIPQLVVIIVGRSPPHTPHPTPPRCVLHCYVDSFVYLDVIPTYTRPVRLYPVGWFWLVCPTPVVGSSPTGFGSTPDPTAVPPHPPPHSYG